MITFIAHECILKSQSYLFIYFILILYLLQLLIQWLKALSKQANI